MIAVAASCVVATSDGHPSLADIAGIGCSSFCRSHGPSRDARRLLMASPRPSRALRTGSHMYPDRHGGPKRLIASTAKRVEGRTTRQNNLARCTSSALASEEGIALGEVAQRRNPTKSRRFPSCSSSRLRLVDPIDAMGCQKEIARDIVDGGGDSDQPQGQPTQASRSDRSTLNKH